MCAWVIHSRKAIITFRLAIRIATRPGTKFYTARYDFCPHNIDMAIILPKTSEYVNNCFHVHELKPEEMPSVIL